jgi:hypothetical protein
MSATPNAATPTNEASVPTTSDGSCHSPCGSTPAVAANRMPAVSATPAIVPRVVNRAAKLTNGITSSAMRGL